MVKWGNVGGEQSESVELQGRDSGLDCFALLLQFLGRPASPEQIRHARGRGDDPFTTNDLLRAARQLGVEARLVKMPINHLGNTPLPAIAWDKSDNFFILASVTASPGSTYPEKALIQKGDSDTPDVWTGSELTENYAGSIILMTTREKTVGDQRAFGFSWFIPALIKYRHALRDVLIASFFLQLLGLVTPLFFQLVIDKVLAHNSLTTLQVLMIGLCSVAVFEVVLEGLRTWLFAHTTNRIDAELGAQLFRHLVALPLSYFESRRVGDSIARVRELETIREFLTSTSITLMLDVLFTFVFLAVMAMYSVFLTAVVIASIPFFLVISLFITPLLRVRLNDKFKRGADNQAFLVETVSSIRTLKSMAVEPQMRNRWEQQLAGYTATGFAVNRLANWGNQFVQLVAKLTTAAILFFGAGKVISGELTIGALVAFNMLNGHVTGPILRVAQLWQNFQQVRISVDRLGDVLNAPAEPSHDPTKSELPAISGHISFERIRFRYRPDAPEVLSNISLEVKAGEMLGIVGPSGSGKSTLTKLIQRLYVPSQGRVSVDGTDLSLVDPSWLRRQIGVVLQENELLNRSVRENIALADPTLSMARVIEAAQLAGAHEFILAMPQAYDTLIDERGSNLSGGQRQRLAIARALIINPRILILDEATSSLDAESEEIVQNNLKSMAHGRTVIIIAHRLSAVRQCNRIVTVERGVITEIGTHESLLVAGGRYADLYRRQMGVAGMLS